MDLFEYATVRVVPRVERGEFINVGVVLFCKNQRFLRTRIALDNVRLAGLFPEADADDIEKHLHSFEAICEGKSAKSPIATLDAASRFRWLTARRSTVIQTSEVHPGLCEDAESTLMNLLKQLVAS